MDAYGSRAQETLSAKEFEVCKHYAMQRQELDTLIMVQLVSDLGSALVMGVKNLRQLSGLTVRNSVPTKGSN